MRQVYVRMHRYLGLFMAGFLIVAGLSWGIWLFGIVALDPDLGTLDGDDLSFKIDFRSVYAGVLKHWFGIDSEPVLLGRFDALPIVPPA